MIWIGNRLLRRKLNARKKDVALENAAILRDLWSLRMLTSRSVIAIARVRRPVIRFNPGLRSRASADLA